MMINAKLIKITREATNSNGKCRPIDYVKDINDYEYYLDQNTGAILAVYDNNGEMILYDNEKFDYTPKNDDYYINGRNGNILYIK